jgi:nicotinamide-nucleotide amidase
MNGLDDTFDDAAVHAAGQAFGRELQALGLMAVTAESCTGGLVAVALTETAGSSAWFDRGFVTYTNLAKHESLGVPLAVLEAHGAVSEAVAREMAHGALRHSGAQVAMAVTGIAGPTGATPGKPVGTVCFGWAFRVPVLSPDTPLVWAQTLRFDGDRAAVRRQSAVYVLREASRRLAAEIADRPPVA